VATLLRGFPGNGSEGALEEGVVDDVAFVILTFDNPIAGIGFALSRVGEDKSRVDALGGIDKKGPAGAKRVHETVSWRRYFAAEEYFSRSSVRML
jgi:hypothetical protein